MTWLRCSSILALACSLVPAAAAGENASAPPGWRHDWARGAVFYEVFVRSFADSTGDGVGDLAGLTARLDYLNDGDPATDRDLGVDALWLMPVFESPSYHGYDVVDYERIDGEYGTLEEFQRLLSEAHRRGMRVIVDLVMNHTSAQHPWFVEAASGPGAARRDWYLWRADDPGWTQPWGGTNRTWHEHGGAFYYGIFWGGMPDLNFDHPEVRAEMKRLARLWLERGVDGFRLDATRHLFASGPGELQNDRPETHAFLRELAAYVREIRPDSVLVGENWTDTAAIAAYYGAGLDELPMNFNFPLAAGMVEAVAAGDAGAVESVLDEMAARYPSGALDAPFLTNHDQTRLATRLGRDSRRMALAASILLTLPGAPFLYYGEEVGLADGQLEGDPAKRTPMPWDASGRGFTSGAPWVPPAPGAESASVEKQDPDAGSLLSHYRRWIRLRRATPALGLGGLTRLEAATPRPSLLSYLREAPGAPRVLVVHNLGSSPAEASFRGLAAERLRPLAGDGAAAVDAEGIHVALPPLSSAVFALD